MAQEPTIRPRIPLERAESLVKALHAALGMNIFDGYLHADEKLVILEFYEQLKGCCDLVLAKKLVKEGRVTSIGE